MGRTLGALVVGTGYAGTRHVDAVRALSGAEIVAVVASSDQRAREASLALGLTVSAEGYKAALRDDRVDVVHVCTPNDRHAEVVEAALRAGKHVICEKPLATDVETARALAALARGAAP